MAMFATERRRPLQVEEVLRMVELGILTGDDRVELLNGELFERTPQGPAHSANTVALANVCRRAYGLDFVREEKPLVASATDMPEPDLVVTDKPNSAFGSSHPGGTDTVLVVELAVTSQPRDADRAAMYARAGVPEYWIVDLPALEIVVHTGPRGVGTWARVVRLAAGQQVTLPGTATALDVGDGFLTP